MSEQENSAFVNDEKIYNKTIKVVPAPEKEIGIDTKDYIFQNIINAGTASVLNTAEIESFTQVSYSREQVYQLLDSMCTDSRISGVLETYAEDATEYNDKGQIVWVESSDSNVAAYVQYLLDSLRVDKNIYKWVYGLCKYGDVYLRLYRQSDYTDLLFEPRNKKLDENVKQSSSDNKLEENVKIKAYAKGDKYVHYVEMVPNPGEVFELTRFGKTAGYIQTSINSYANQYNSELNMMQNPYFHYKFKQRDVQLFSATEFVHACLDDNSVRNPEEVEIFINNAGEINDVNSVGRYGDFDDQNSGSNSSSNDVSMSYSVKRGKSLLLDSYKVWRETQLLETSVLLNRVTQSSISRIIQVEVGDMPKEQVGVHLQGIKNMLEQKAAINTGAGMAEYTNPGPIINNIYVPTHGGIGSITASAIGGDYDPKSLVDLEYYLNALYGGLRVPKQYFCLRGDTEILLLNGHRDTIKNLFEHRDEYIGKGIMACDTDGTMVPTKIKNIMLTKKNASFVRVTLDNGKYFDVTPDHRVMLRDGTFVEAQDLKENDSVMPYDETTKSSAGTCKVVLVQFLDVAEDAFDIEVESDVHTFVLPCGVVVHNCQTDDATGFNGGTSLSIISSRYAKVVKRIQNTMIQAITDIINLMLIDNGLEEYINRFDIRMMAPTTQEEKDRRENTSTRLQLVRDTMDLISDIDDQTIKMKVLKGLLSSALSNQEVTECIQDYIDKVKKEQEDAKNDEVDVETSDDVEYSDMGGGSFDVNEPMNFETSDESSGGELSSEGASEESSDQLPSASSIGVDLTEA